MKIEIDFSEKTISVNDSINLGELFKCIKTLTPKGEWKHFKIKPIERIAYKTYRKEKDFRDDYGIVLYPDDMQEKDMSELLRVTC